MTDAKHMPERFDMPLWSEVRDYVATIETLTSQLRARLGLSDSDKARLRADPASELDLRASYEEFLQNDETFPHLLRRSAFVFVMTYLEVQLETLCGAMRAVKGSRFTVGDLAGSGIFRSALYIDRVWGVQIRGL